MPRNHGVFDNRTPEQAYGEGKAEYENGTQTEGSQFTERVAQDMPMDILTGSDSRTEQEKSYDAGHEAAKEESKSWW